MNFTSIQPPLTEALGWTLLHSLWQGVLIAVILAVAIRFIKNKSPQLIYLLSCISLISLVAWMVSTFVSHFHWPMAGEMSIVDFALNGTFEDASLIAAMSWQENIDLFFQSFIQSYADELVMLWLLGVALFGLKWSGTMYFTYSLKNQSLSAASPQWQKMVKQFSEKLGIKKSVSIYQSSKVDVPMVIGFLKPVILLPASIISGFTTEQIESIIVHELAHIKSNDYLIGLILSAMEVVLFYHPMYWWVSGIIMQEREKRCDDIAVTHCGNPLLYARTLFTIAEHKQQRSLALSLQGKKHQLFERIKRVCISPQGKMKTNNKAGMSLGLLFVMAIMAVAQVPANTKEAFIEPMKDAIIDQFVPELENEDTEFGAHLTDDTEGVEEENKAADLVQQIDTIPPSKANGKSITLITRLDAEGNVSIVKKDVNGEIRAYLIKKNEGDIYVDNKKLNPGNYKMVLPQNTRVTFVGTTTLIDKDVDEEAFEGLLADEESAAARYDEDINTFFEENESISESERVDRDEMNREALERMEYRNQKRMQELQKRKNRDLEDRIQDQNRAEDQRREAMELQREEMEIQREEMERRIEEQAKAYEEVMENRQKEMELQREEMERRIEEQAKAYEEVMENRQKNMELQREDMERRIEERARAHEEAIKLHQLAMEEKQEEVSRRREEHDEMVAQNDKFHDILSNKMLADGLIKKKHKYKFELSYDQLKVNKKKQSSEMHKKYLQLYQEYYGKEISEKSNVTIQKN